MLAKDAEIRGGSAGFIVCPFEDVAHPVTDAAGRDFDEFRAIATCSPIAKRSLREAEKVCGLLLIDERVGIGIWV